MISDKYLEVAYRIFDMYKEGDYERDLPSYRGYEVGERSCYFCCGKEEKNGVLCFDLSEDFISDRGVEIFSRMENRVVFAHEECIEDKLKNKEEFIEESLDRIRRVRERIGR